MKLSKELKIAIIALITLVALFWGLNFLKGISIFKSVDEYYASYDDIQGLIESGVVFLKGYKVGNVRSINFDKKNPGKIIVKFALEEKVNIPVNSTAMITSSSMISEIKDISLILGDSSSFASPGDTLIGVLNKGMSAFIEPIKYQAEETLASIDSVLEIIRSTLDKTTQTNIQNSIANLEDITSSLSGSLAADGDLAKSLENLEKLTTALRDKSEELSAILVNFSAFSDSLVSSEIKSAINNTNKTLAETSAILEKINKGEGTAGMLVNNDTLYHNLKNAAASLDILIKDLNEHPKKYVHFSLFGRKNESEKPK
jgi:phospholipid/cholesterol/gamma-HCH transport system substrate-binding protein